MSVTLELDLGDSGRTLTANLYPVAALTGPPTVQTFAEVLDASENPTGAYQSSTSLLPGTYYAKVFDSGSDYGAWFFQVGQSGVARALSDYVESDSSVIGPGSKAYTDFVYAPDGITPVANARVWVTTDVLGTNVIAGTVYTTDLGQFTLMLDSGSYYLWVDSVQANFNNPVQITVS